MKRRPSLVAVLAFLAIVGIAEGAARIGELRVAPAPTWGTVRIDTKVAQMQTLAEAGGVDVVFLGSSVAETGINPQAFVAGSEWSDTAFNAGLTAAGPQAVEMWAQEVVLPLLQPEVVVIAMTSRDLNDAGVTQANTLNRYVDSVGRARFLGTPSFGQRLESELSRWSALMRLRRNLSAPHQFLTELASPLDSHITDFGFVTLLENRTYANDDDSNGEQLANYQLNDYWVGGVESAALRRIIDLFVASGAEVYVVDMPVLDAAYEPLHPNGAADIASYGAALAAVVNASDAIFLDATGVATDTTMFANHNHLNGVGADRLTAWLAEQITPPK